MITTLFLDLIVLFLGGLLSFFDNVTKLPVIVGFDIDGALVTGVGQLYTFFGAFWPLGTMFLGFLALMLYYSGKIALRLFLGHRSP